MLGRLITKRVVPAALGLTVGFTVKSTAACESARIPSRFGSSVRSFSSRDGGMDISNKDDCPVCKKYSQGPCGETFKKWLSCTDANPGKDAHGEEIYLSKCETIFEPFVKCLEQNKDFYEELDMFEEDEASEEDLFEAWNKVISEVETTRTAIDFPNSLPEVQIRLRNNTGMVTFSYKLPDGQRVVMCYVKDDDTGEVLAAGSSDDLWPHEGKGILRLSFGPKCRAVTTYALYSDENDSDTLYRFTQLMPR